MTFMLHPQLAADTVEVGDMSICKVLLNKQYSQHPWLILVPKRTGCRDITDVPPADYLPMMDEVRHVHDALKAFSKADKMNVGALGNLVPQLHIHVIARHTGDAAWPAPVWGTPVQPYADGGAAMAARLRAALDI